MPIIFASILSWIAEKFGTFAAKRAYKLAAAAAFAVGMVASLGALIALVTVVPSPPAAITAVMGYLMPSDWGAQLSIIVGARAYSLVWYTWREGFKIALNGG